MRVAAPLFETPASKANEPSTASQPDTSADTAPPAARPADDRVTVTQLASLINGALRDGLPAKVHVVGEVSGFKDQTHWWFRLKDEGAVIECVMFASAARKHGGRLRDGDEVVARGRVEHYPKQGRTQLYVDRIEPIGAGALERKFRDLCDELRSLGCFDADRKKPLPIFPKRVAVITSKTGAAVQDVLDTFRRRAPFVPLLIVDVRVQGDGAATGIAAAIDRVGRERTSLGIDAIILTRGGGSLEDLWAFNERLVADAILRCPVPIVAAIGHETDTSIAELVADERAATPTQAAVRLAPDRDAFAQQIEHHAARLRAIVQRIAAHDAERLRSVARHPFLRDPRTIIVERVNRVDRLERTLAAAVRGTAHREHARLASLTARLARRRPEAIIADRSARLREAERRLASVVRGLLDRRRAELVALARTLDATGPINVLRRGFTLTTRADGRLVRSPGEVEHGDLITTRTAEGDFVSTVGEHQTPRRPHTDSGPLFDRDDPA